ncbi:MAG: pilin, partial [Woeseiaceae bacterium]|nr:pilin [Woeseiaceae bacterium]
MHGNRLILPLILSVALLASSTPQLAVADSGGGPGMAPIREAWLRDHLPEESLIYFRVPHLFGIFATAKGNALDGALRSEANAANVAKIRRGIVDNVLPLLPNIDKSPLKTIEERLRSPIEVALILEPAPTMLMSMNLDIDSEQAFNDVIGDFGTPAMPVSLAAPLDERGVGQLTGMPAPTFVRFDSATGALLVNVGPAVTAQGFDSYLATVEGGTAHRMRDIERRIDESGQGLFAWIDSARALPFLKLMIQPDQYQVLTDFGLDRFSAAGIGWGVANGKGRIAAVADVLPNNERHLLPLVSNRLDAASAGDPDGVLLLSFPTREEFQRLEAQALETASAESRQDWLDAKAKIVEAIGVPIEDFFDALGPELMLIFDRAGDYLAVRVQNERLWNRIARRLADSTGGALDERRIGRATYHHLSMPSAMNLLGEAEIAKMEWFGELFSRQQEHMYWMRDGDFLYAATIPQPLIDRVEMRARTDIGEWLRSKQRIDASEAVISLSGTTRKLPRRLYSAYIEILQLLADLSLVEIDVWSMPTPAQLGMPEIGTLAFNLNFGDPTLSAELVFENNPGEFLGGLGGVATAGILAAIAIPAYQDYTVRAKVAEGLNLAASVKAGVAEYYLEYGRYPDAHVAAAMSLDGDAGRYVDGVIVEPGSGRITIYFRDGEVPGGGELYLS